MTTEYSALHRAILECGDHDYTDVTTLHYKFCYQYNYEKKGKYALRLGTALIYMRTIHRFLLVAFLNYRNVIRNDKEENLKHEETVVGGRTLR